MSDLNDFVEALDDRTLQTFGISRKESGADQSEGVIAMYATTGDDLSEEVVIIAVAHCAFDGDLVQVSLHGFRNGQRAEISTVSIGDDALTATLKK